MKLTLLLSLLLTAQVSFAQSLKEKKQKQEMLERVDSLTLKIDESRDALEKEDVVVACAKINEIFGLLPDHLVSIGSRMNPLDSKVMRMEQETKMFLIDIHKRSNICAFGETGEYLDIKETSKKLKSMKKALRKQKKRISKSDTNYNNKYNYYYEFH